MGFVYKIVNEINNKVYIGITRYKNPIFRFYKHKMEYNSSTNYSKRPLYEAIQKHGIKNFKFFVIEEVNNDLLSEREKYWIQYYKSYIGFNNSKGYNATLGGDSGHALVSSDEVEKIRHLYQKEKNIKTVCKKLHHTFTTVRRCLNISSETYKVAQLDKNLNVINIFNNLAEANLKMNKNKKSGHIGLVCKGKRKTAYGYYWKFIK